MSGHPHSYYVRTASAFRKRRYLLVKGILPQAILEYLKVYYAVITRSAVYWLASLVITNLCTQSQRFFLENDTLFRSGLL